MHPALQHAETFAQTFGLRVPILLAPMAGACPPALSIAVAQAGGLGAAGVLLMSPEAIGDWVRQIREKTNGGFQLNTWIPDPPPKRDAAQEAELRAFLGSWGPQVPETAGDAAAPDFSAQCEAMLAAGPTVVSSIMGVYPPEFVERMKARGIHWFATVTTLAEARAAEAAGADAVIAQGAEAGGHRGAFDAASAERQAVGLFALLPAVVDAVNIPVVAAGGIVDARGMAAALLLGANAVQIGTAFLRCPEAGIAPAWAEALASTAPEDTMVTRAFSGRAGRSVATDYARAAAAPDVPAPAPYPIQRALTAAMRGAGTKADDIARIQAWAGQSAAMAKAVPAATLVDEIWSGTRRLLG